MEKGVTLADIAARTGLSVSAVSLALRNKPGIPAETRERVLELADELGYQGRQRKHLAPQSATRIRTLAAVIKSDYDVAPQANAFYSHVLAGIEQACRQRQLNLLFANLPVDRQNNPTDVPRVLRENQADALLLVGVHVGPRLGALLQQKAALIGLVDGYADVPLYDSVVTDNQGGAYQLVKRLIARGHQRIACASSAAVDFPSFQERRDGYLQAMTEHGLAPIWFDFSGDPRQTRDELHTLQRATPNVSAIFGCNDVTALNLLRAGKSLGCRIPQDFSLAGFDDVEEAGTVTPGLTTMAVDKVSMGWNAVMLLLNRAENPGGARVTLVLHTRLVERESVADCIG